MGLIHSYQSKKIISWLKEKNIVYTLMTDLSSGMNANICIVSVVNIPLNKYIRLSINTSPIYVTDSFAHSMLIVNDIPVTSEELGYNGINTHAEPEDLFQQIDDLFESLKELDESYGNNFDKTQPYEQTSETAQHNTSSDTDTEIQTQEITDDDTDNDEQPSKKSRTDDDDDDE